MSTRLVIHDTLTEEVDTMDVSLGFDATPTDLLKAISADTEIDVDVEYVLVSDIVRATTRFVVWDWIAGNDPMRVTVAQMEVAQ